MSIYVNPGLLKETPAKFDRSLTLLGVLKEDMWLSFSPTLILTI